ncbi:MAG: hypothetical protein H6854_05060 [Rhodospirillales bacterium]|nr:hypothetical protein [Rhodospirillales bacterium]
MMKKLWLSKVRYQLPSFAKLPVIFPIAAEHNSFYDRPYDNIITFVAAAPEIAPAPSALAELLGQHGGVIRSKPF